MSAVSAVAATAPEGAARSEGVTIRFSRTGEDVEERIMLARRACSEMNDPDLPFDEEIVRRGIARKLGSPGRPCLLQAEAGGRTVGMLSGAVGTHYHSPALAASVLSWYVLPEHRGSVAAIKLLHGFRRWARDRGAARLYVHVSSGIDMSRTDRLLKRLGFAVRGGNYGLAL